MNEKNPDLSHSPRTYDVFKLLIGSYLRTIGVEYEGVEHIPAQGGALLAANHVTLVDPFAVGLPSARRVHFMSKVENFATPWGRWFMENGNAFPVDRGKADLSAIKTAIRLLQKGQLLVLFPQGTRGGEAAKDGVGFIALRGKAPVVPCGVSLLPNWFGGKRFKIKFGPPIAPEGTAEELTARVMAAINGLIEP